MNFQPWVIVWLWNRLLMNYSNPPQSFLGVNSAVLPSSPRRINKSRGFGSTGGRSRLQKTGASHWKWLISLSEREGPRLANRSAQWVRPGIRGGFSFPNDSCPFAPTLHLHPRRQRELPGGGSPAASSSEDGGGYPTSWFLFSSSLCPGEGCPSDSSLPPSRPPQLTLQRRGRTSGALTSANVGERDLINYLSISSLAPDSHISRPGRESIYWASLRTTTEVSRIF